MVRDPAAPIRRSEGRLMTTSLATTIALIAPLCGATAQPPASAIGATPLSPTYQGKKHIPYVGHRLLFVWSGDIAGDDVETNRLLRFARTRRIDTIAIGAYDVGYDNPNGIANYTDFVNRAHDLGIDVLALGGCGWFTVPCDAGIPGQDTCWDEGWGYYETIALSGVPFDGIFDDSEPYSANNDDWWARVEERSQNFIDYLRGVDERIGALPFYHAIPFWYDENPDLLLTIDGETEPHTLNWYVARLVDTPSIMAYRDHAEAPDGILDHTAGEIEMHPAVIGVETADVSPAKITFWDEGYYAMERELEEVYAAYGAHPNFRGFFIHDYDAYQGLMP